MMMVFLISFVVLSPSYAVIITRPLVTSDTETTTMKDNGNPMINNQSQQQQFTQCIDNIMNKIQKGEINLDDPGLYYPNALTNISGEKRIGITITITIMIAILPYLIILIYILSELSSGILENIYFYHHKNEYLHILFG